MIVGNGLLAKAFHSFKDNPDVLIFASGVSNSRTNNPQDFKREIDLINNYSQESALLVYFSTCSIYDNNPQNSLYINHKINVESIIEQNFENYLIVRLPNVIGKSKNPHTMTNYFHQQISQNEELQIQKDAFRYFIDIDDVAIKISELLTQGANRKQNIDLVISDKVSVLAVVEEIADMIGKTPKYQLIEGVSSYEVYPSDEFGLNQKLIDGREYLRKSLQKIYC